ncbi:hypothetical protein CKA27_02955 [Vibrio coralliilyticus]|nr:hypothetical protein CKA27_02955 [Vibrio coralliilyticus]
MARQKSPKSKSASFLVRLHPDELAVYEHVSKILDKPISQIIREEMASFCSQFEGVSLND